jgi:uncharacterized Tic20 family protein
MAERIQERPAAVAPTTTSEERTWAAIAHASGLVTMLISLSTMGLGAIPFVFVPLVIYLVYREKSKYVAFHAAQAFAFQVVGTVGYFVLMLVAILAAALVTAIGAVLTIILIGLLVLAVAAIVWVLIPVAYVLLPVVLGVISGLAAIETSSGHEYRYPYLGAWVEDWLNRHSAPPAPAV